MSQINYIKYSVTTNHTIRSRPTINQVGVVCQSCNNNGNCIVCNNMFTDSNYILTTKNAECLIKNTLCGSTLNIKCLTCKKVDECAGHVYNINLGTEILYKLSYIKYIKNILDKICINCKSVLIHLNDNEREVLQKFHDTNKISNNLIKLRERLRKQDKICQNCNNPIVKLKYKASKSYFAISGKISCTSCKNNQKGCGECNLKKYSMAPTSSLILEAIKVVYEQKEHYLIVDYKTNPCEFFYNGCYPVPQKTIRTEQYTFESITNQAPTTTAIIQMMKNHERILKNADGSSIVHCRHEIQKLIDNSEFAREDQKSSSDNNNQACHYSMGVTSKDATVRQHINGGRPNSTSKMVLSLTGNIDIEHCNLPPEYINIMTTFVAINDFTIDLIENLILEGEVFGYYSLTINKYHSSCKALKSLRSGDLVEVRFMTGPESLILIGRYPSLHQYSLIVNAVMPSSDSLENNQTIRFSLCHFPNMNADQDGDEAYSVKMSTSYANFEIMLVLRSSVNIISPSDGSQSKGIVYDEIVNLSALLTKKKITLYEAYRLLGIHWKRLKTGKLLYTGLDIISCLYPKNMNKEGVFNNGKFLKQGLQLSDIATGPSTINSIARPINELYSRYDMYTFISTLIHIARESLEMFPYSIGIADYVSSMDFMKSNIEETSELAQQVQLNLNTYRNDVINKLIFPMSDDELARMLVSEFDKISKVIKTKITQHFKTMKNEYNEGKKSRNLWLIYNSGFKLSDETFQNVCGQPKSDDSISRTSYWQRLRPTVEPCSFNVYANGLVRYPLLRGYDMNDKLIMLSTARKQVNNIITATSKKGDSARKMTKCLEDMVVSELGWISYENTILNTHVNSYHLLNDYLVMVIIDMNFISELPDSKYNNNLRSLFVNTCNYMVAENRSNINLNIASPVDFNLIIDSCHENYELKNEHIDVPKIDGFYSDEQLIIIIENIRSHILNTYMLSMGYTSSLEFLMYYFLCPHKRTVNYYQMCSIIDSLEMKYRRGNTPGTPIGIRAALSISEKDTQAALSSFHDFNKSGTSIKNISQADNSRFTNFKPDKTKGVTILYCKNYRKLIDIKRGIEWCTLRYLYEDFQFTESGGYNIIIPHEKLYRYNLTMTDVYNMTVNYLSRFELEDCAVINIRPEFFKNVRTRIIMNIKATFTNRLSKCEFEMSMLDGISKGLLSRYNIQIEEVQIYNSELEKEDTYKLTMFLTDTWRLSMYDTTDMIIVLPTEEIPKYFGMVNTLNSLSYSYTSDGIDRINYVILSMFQCRQTTPRTILKFKMGECSAAKSVTYGTGFNDYPYAAVHNKIEKCDADISSCILNSLKIKVGTGFYQTSYKISMLPSFDEIPIQEYAD